MVLNHSIMVKNETIGILKHLIDNSEQEFTIRELSIVRAINYKSAYQAVGKLEKDGCVKVRKKGNTKLCSFTRIFTNLVFISEKERLDKSLKNSDLKVIYKELTKIKTQAILLLFGSYVKGGKTKNSDIDLLIISENTDAIEKQISWIPKNIHTTCMSYMDFDSMLKSKEFSVVSEVIKKNIILQGIEDYYRFIENAR
jgi:predicted nucleotidyltransferase